MVSSLVFPITIEKRVGRDLSRPSGSSLCSVQPALPSLFLGFFAVSPQHGPWLSTVACYLHGQSFELTGYKQFFPSFPALLS